MLGKAWNTTREILNRLILDMTDDANQQLANGKKLHGKR
jgi:hypothetical protein